MPGTFEDGEAAGRIAERLDQHDTHFQKINGSMEIVATELKALRLEYQRLADQAISSAATVIATALALEKADTARRNRGEQLWSPLQKLISVGLALIALAGLYIAWTHSVTS